MATLLDKTATTAASATDLVYIVRDPTGTPVDRKMAIDDFFKSRQGNVSNLAYASLNAAVTAIGATVATVEIPATTTVSSSLTVPANITLRLQGGAQISVSASQTLTINGAIEAPLRQIFTGSGTVVLNGAIPSVYVTWFGALGDAKIVTDGAMTASSGVLTSATAAFTNADVGKKVDVAGVGASAELSAIITGFTSTTQVTVSVVASYTGSSKTVLLDNTTIATGSMTAGSNTLTTGSAFFNSGDVGKLVRVTDVGAKNLTGTISSFTNSTTVTLSFNAAVTVSGCKVIYGTDDNAAIAKGISSLANGGELYFPKVTTGYVNGSALTIATPNITLRGAGMMASVIYSVGPKMLDNPSVFHSIHINQPANSIHFQNLGFSGTNWTAQTTSFGVDTADGIYISSIGPISNITATGCRFDSFWGIGFHAPGSAGLTIAASNAVKDIILLKCRASLNSYDGFNPNVIAGLVVSDCLGIYNGSAALESSASNGAITGNYFYYNLFGGMSIGGYGDPQTSEAFAITGNVCNLNGEYGITLASNQCSTIISGNTCRLNGLFGIGALASGGTLAKRNRITGNICDSNGRTGGSGIYLNMDFVECEGNTCTDRGVSGYQQNFGVLSYGNNLTISRNYSLGNVVQDYSFQAGSATFDNIYSTAVIFNGGAAITYVNIPFRGAYDPGPFSLPANQFLLQYKQLRISGNSRATMTGSGQIVLTTFQPVGRLVLSGSGGIF